MTPILAWPKFGDLISARCAEISESGARMQSREHRRSRGLKCVWALTALFATTCADVPRPVEQPNIIFVIADDHGYPYSGFMGSDVVRTPHLDTLAREGTVFTHGFTAASVCQPSMFSLLTGLHPEQWKAEIERSGRKQVPPLDETILTLPRVLSEAGYRTFQGGKYWGQSYLDGGFTDGTKEPFGPNSAKTHEFGPLANMVGGRGLNFGRTSLQALWDFLEAPGADAPFFVWFAPMLPHGPFNAPQRFRRLYDEPSISAKSRSYYANVSWFDDAVGQLLAYLESKDLRRSTLIVYVSDNGLDQAPEDQFCCGPHGKLTLYELGFRTPVIFSWPGQLAEGVVRNDLVSTVDLFPTLIEFAGAEMPSHRHGVSLLGALLHQEPVGRDRVVGGMSTMKLDPGPKVLRTAVEESRGYFIRTAQWHYLWFVDRDREELYRIEEDPDETHNVVSERADLARQFHSDVEQWRRSMSSAYPRQTTRGRRSSRPPARQASGPG